MKCYRWYTRVKCQEVTAVLKVVRKFAQKNCSEKDVLSLRSIEREIYILNSVCLCVCVCVQQILNKIRLVLVESSDVDMV